MVERKPPMLQIAVEISFGLIPDRRARSALVEHARTASGRIQDVRACFERFRR